MQIKKFKRLFFIIFFLIPNIAVSDEDLAGYTEAISEVQDKFTELSAGESKEAKIIDEAIKEINKATEFAKRAVANEDNENALCDPAIPTRTAFNLPFVLFTFFFIC